MLTRIKAFWITVARFLLGYVYKKESVQSLSVENRDVFSNVIVIGLLICFELGYAILSFSKIIVEYNFNVIATVCVHFGLRKVVHAYLNFFLEHLVQINGFTY